MQFFWLYVDDLVGKGLNTLVIFKLIAYVTATLVPLALPLAILLSSIMTFGNLGETFEIVAIKSAGIPLLRFMRPLFFITLLLTCVAFFFANNIIPVAQLKLETLKTNIIKTQPALDIKEGTFYDKIPGFVIKIGKKDPGDSIIRNVIIYEKDYNLQDNMLIASHGVMRVTADKNFLEFILYDGWRYQEKGPRFSPNTDYIRLGFKEYKKVLDLSSLAMGKMADSAYMYDPKMLSVRQLTITIDSIKKINNTFIKQASPAIEANAGFTKKIDTGWVDVKTTKQWKTGESFTAAIPDSIRGQVFNMAIGQLANTKGNISIYSSELGVKVDSLRHHQIEWNRKFTLSIACLVMFLIGAPLGSIIRKGGLGMPLVFAIIFFVIFYIFNTFGEKFAKENVTSVAFGMWLSTLVLTPIGIFLTYKAMRDSQLMNSEFYYRSFRSIRDFFSKLRLSKKSI
jgi:lipopolysaccharide export system permease protein